jgi:hypothetical protein
LRNVIDANDAHRWLRQEGSYFRPIAIRLKPDRQISRIRLSDKTSRPALAFFLRWTRGYCSHVWVAEWSVSKRGAEMVAVEWWVVIATLAGPVIAVQTQKWIERASERSKRRQWIFMALMANRATRLNDDYVKALNLIDLEFSPHRFGGSSDKPVIDAWRALFGELAHGIEEGEQDAVILRAWNKRGDELLVALLSEMSKRVGHNFSMEELRRGIYYPRGRLELEQSYVSLLHGLSGILKGQNAIPMKITEVPGSGETAALQVTLNERMTRAYDDDGSFKVRMQP